MLPVIPARMAALGNTRIITQHVDNREEFKNIEVIHNDTGASP
jgi:hypothetical protein